MRLPQSSSRLLSLFVSVALFTTLTAVLPAATQTSTSQFSFSPPRLGFGAVPLGQSETQIVVTTNTGSSNATISAVSVSNPQFSVSNLKLPLVLSAGQSVTLTVVFAPTAKGWTGEKTMTFENSASQAIAQLAIAGVGEQSQPVSASPASLSFGSVPVKTKSTQSVVLTNNSSENQTLNAFWPQTPYYFVSSPTLPITLSPGQSLTVNVTFSPQVAGVDGGSVFIYGPSLDIPVSGTGTTATSVGQLTIAPSAVSFGSVDVGATSKEAITLSATGGSVTVTSAASSNSEFAIPGATFPLTIDAGNSAQLDVVFAPTQSGTASGTLTFATNASNPQSSESLGGVGVLPTYSVQLSWSPSTSSVAGYNVYRGTTVGQYSRINSALDATTAFTDTTVVSGTIYYYAATAVSSNGDESAYSQPLKVTIP